MEEEKVEKGERGEITANMLQDGDRLRLITHDSDLAALERDHSLEQANE